jgi:hypothetical protein
VIFEDFTRCAEDKNSPTIWPGYLDFLERETGFEPATSTLARLHSTTELFPLDGAFAVKRGNKYQTILGKSIKISWEKFQNHLILAEILLDPGTM